MKQMRMIKRSFVALKKQIRLAVKELNQEAARQVGNGRYETSGTLIECAKKVGEFAKDVEALRARWVSITSTKQGGASGEKTPLWEYYSLIAQSISELGGKATREQIVDWIAQNGANQLKSGDFASNVQGKPYWQRILRRVKRAMAEEKYLETAEGAEWSLTKLCRDVAKQKKKP